MRVQLFNLARKRDTLNDVTTRQPFANGPFAKMVAKIGYCYAVAKLGFDAFDGDAIRELLAGKRDDVYNFVGNVEKTGSALDSAYTRLVFAGARRLVDCSRASICLVQCKGKRALNSI